MFTETCPTPLERVLRRDRAIVSIALAIVTLLAWLYVLRLAADMDMGSMDMTGRRMVSTGIRMVMTPSLQPSPVGSESAKWTVIFLLSNVPVTSWRSMGERQRGDEPPDEPNARALHSYRRDRCGNAAKSSRCARFDVEAALLDDPRGA